MSRLALLAFAISLPFRAGSDVIVEQEAWTKVSELAFESEVVPTTRGNSLKARLEYDQGLTLFFYVENLQGDNYADCKDSGSRGFRAEVNGRIMRMAAECAADRAKLTIISSADEKYVIDEFITKDFVHLGGGRLSTNGFLEGYSELKRYRNYVVN